MKAPDLKKIISSLESRKQGEKGVLLGMACLVLAYAWLILVSDQIDSSQAEFNRRITVVNAQIAEQANQYVSVQRNYRTDPDAFARNKEQELQQAIIEADERLRKLYGQLVQPQQMAQVLTNLLQSETTLKLISLQNSPSSVLANAGTGTLEQFADETEGAAVDGAATGNGINVYRHGLQMIFEGDYLETIRYLRSLENLETSFFWQSVNYEVVNWPVSRITLDIFTLSTQGDWIGV